MRHREKAHVIVCALFRLLSAIDSIPTSVNAHRTFGPGDLHVAAAQCLLHLRSQRGVGEPLDETMCGTSGSGCAGLTMRGSAFLVVDTIENAHATRRELVETLNVSSIRSPLPALRSPLFRLALSFRVWSPLSAANQRLSSLAQSSLKVCMCGSSLRPWPSPSRRSPRLRRAWPGSRRDCLRTSSS